MAVGRTFWAFVQRLGMASGLESAQIGQLLAVAALFDMLFALLRDLSGQEARSPSSARMACRFSREQRPDRYSEQG